MSFLAYYLHWSHQELMNMEHGERRRWCSEVSAINKKLNGTPGNVFDPGHPKNKLFEPEVRKWR